MAERKPLHVVMFSTGMSSAYLAKLILDEHGNDDTVFLFTDTRWEDEDNYRFMNDVSRYLRKDITWVMDGRTPEEVFFDQRFFGNFGTAPCSKELKMKQTVIFVEDQRLNGREPILYFGIGANEKQRAPRIAENYSHNCLEPVEARFPLIDRPDLTNERLTQIIQTEWGIRRPRMYDLGFKHANCGGRCVKGGVGHYTTLHHVWPERFREQVEMERRFRNEINDYTLLKRNGEPLPLEELEKTLDSLVYLDIPDAEEMPCTCVF